MIGRCRDRRRHRACRRRSRRAAVDEARSAALPRHRGEAQRPDPFEARQQRLVACGLALRVGAHAVVAAEQEFLGGIQVAIGDLPGQPEIEGTAAAQRMKELSLRPELAVPAGRVDGRGVDRDEIRGALISRSPAGQRKLVTHLAGPNGRNAIEHEGRCRDAPIRQIAPGPGVGEALALKADAGIEHARSDRAAAGSAPERRQRRRRPRGRAQ